MPAKKSSRGKTQIDAPDGWTWIGPDWVVAGKQIQAGDLLTNLPAEEIEHFIRRGFIENASARPAGQTEDSRLGEEVEDGDPGIQ